jgi:hypothetical protein
VRMLLALALFCFVVPRADAARIRGRDPLLPADAQVVVSGQIVAIESQGEWELGAMDARPGHWLWPYSVAKIRIAEVLKDQSDVQPVQGDTLDVWYVTSAEAHNSEEPRRAIWSETVAEDLNERHLQIGQQAAYFVRHQFEHWYFDAPPANADTTKYLLELMRKDTRKSGNVEGDETER